jgi:hypothetical protein
MAKLAATWMDGVPPPREPEAEAAVALSRAREALAGALVSDLGPPPLDGESLRLGASLYNLLALSHPALQRADGFPARMRERTLAYTADLARLGPPATLEQAVFRHTLLARIAEIKRSEHTVKHWLGRQTYVGMSPPGRILRWPTLRRVEVSSGDRRWLSDIGVPVGARPVWELVQEASPLGEALDPLRLDPPIRWIHLPPVLRFAPLARLVAGRIVSLGLSGAGEAMATAFIRQAQTRETDAAEAEADRAERADGIRFFAHVAWLAQLAGTPQEPGPALLALLIAAVERDLGLVLPPDVQPRGSLATAFLRTLETFRGQPAAGETPYLNMARVLCRDLGPGAGGPAGSGSAPRQAVPRISA